MAWWDEQRLGAVGSYDGRLGGLGGDGAEEGAETETRYGARLVRELRQIHHGRGMAVVMRVRVGRHDRHRVLSRHRGWLAWRLRDRVGALHGLQPSHLVHTSRFRICRARMARRRRRRATVVWMGIPWQNARRWNMHGPTQVFIGGSGYPGAIAATIRFLPRRDTG